MVTRYIAALLAFGVAPRRPNLQHLALLPQPRDGFRANTYISGGIRDRECAKNDWHPARF